MDSRKLSAEEITEIKNFIISRSKRFEEPSILIEILDHFACKIEEELNRDTSISFTEAVHNAHQSFGIKGFAPIAAAWEQHTIKRYKKWRKQENKKILLSLHGLGLLAFGLFTAKLFLILHAKHILPANGFEILLLIMVVYSISVYPIISKKSVTHKNPLLYEKALEANYSISFIPLIMIPFMNELVKSSTNLAAIIIAAFSMTFGFNMIINRRMLRKVNLESANVEQQVSML